MELKEALVRSVQDVFSMFGLSSEFQGESEETHLTSADQVNILLGFNDSMRGSLVLGMGKPSALQLISIMMGGMEVSELDDLAKSGLGEFANMFAGTAFGKIQTTGIVSLTPPTMVTGGNMFLMISRVRALRLMFEFGGQPLHISFCVE